MSNPSIADLQRAIQISEQIEKLEAELKSVLGGFGAGNGQEVGVHSPKKRRGRPPKSAVSDQSLGIAVGNGKKRGISTEGRAKIAAAQKARWAKAKGEKTDTTAMEPKAKKKKRKLSPEARAKIVAAVKARWARANG